jgi:PAS domain S-box-containing protein
MAQSSTTLQDFAFFNNLLEGCQIIGKDFKYLFVNAQVLKHAKKSWEDLLGKTMMEVYPGIENSEMFSLLREVMETGEKAGMLNEFDYPDGSKGWFELKIIPWPDGAMILSMDVTSTKRAEAAS